MKVNTKTHYRSEEAQEHQEVLTPPGLVEHIYSFLTPEELQGDILDPCVGPGALIEPILKNQKNHDFQSLTVGDIQPEWIQKWKDYGFEDFKITNDLDEIW